MGRGDLERWTTDSAAELYGVNHWGAGYFAVAPEGDMVVYPHGEKQGPAVSLLTVAQGLRERGLDMPVLLRFEDILGTEVRRLHKHFAQAITESGYQNRYQGVYPIKVNQQEQVVEQIMEAGAPFHHGLEAGSKAELIAALAFMKDPEALLVCNGYKDQEFIDLALEARRIGIQTVLVVESPFELAEILARAAQLGIRPCLGVRLKLASRAGGHWTDSGGDLSVFGLNSAQVIEMVDRLRAAEMLDCLRLLHFHLGSQMPNIRDIRAAVTEAVRIYVGLVQEGAPMGILDLGGGLAVDYDGSHTNFAASRNYNIPEYCADIVYGVKEILDEAEIAHPMLVTESGRALTAYSSVLLFNVLDVSRFTPTDAQPQPEPDAPDALRNLAELPQAISAKNAQECYHDALDYRDELRQLFRLGGISLRQRAQGEQIFWHVINRVARAVREMQYVPDDFEDLEARLADIYYGNFSVFQSLPDIWAVDQLFPILPIHRLQEAPQRLGVISDITCDCDGKVDRFIDLRDVRRTLPLHELKPDEEYYLGVFLVGAYQETLGDLHNLMGDTHVVNLRVREDGRVEFTGEIEGDSVADVLSYVEYTPKTLVARFRAIAENAVRQGQITPTVRRALMERYEAGLRGYTYFER